ncbi:MAG: hypothetical protein DRN78_02950 [Thermoproteota archaeon]|nr:MAG: hypothetical protein DRN78_02950 [Candidatus Korarchaeota archaeon]
MVDYVLVISNKLRSLAESRGHQVICFDNLPCISIPPSNSEAHRFKDKHYFDTGIYTANPAEVKEAYNHFANLLKEGKIQESRLRVSYITINKWPYGPCDGSLPIDERTEYIDCMEFTVYTVQIGGTTVFFEVEEV